MESSEAGDRSGGACTCRESCIQKAERSTLETFLGIFITLLYHIALYCPFMGERLLERLVFLGCLLKLQVLADGRAGHCCVGAGSRFSDRLANSASFYA